MASIQEINSFNKKNPLYIIQGDKLLPDKTYFFYSDDSLYIQFSPWLTANSGLGQYSRLSCETFLRLLFSHHKELSNINPTSFCEIIPLTGSLHYRFADAFYNVFNRAIPRVFLGVKRFYRDDRWVAECNYLNIDALPKKNPFLFIADTIATGSTLLTLMKEVRNVIEPSEVIGLAFFSIAGALPGIRRIKEIGSFFPNAKVYVYLANALFGLAENGTDMPWLHPDTITSTDIKEKAIENYSEYLATNWCTIWDWGNRSNDPLAHLTEMKELIQQFETRGIEYDQVTKTKLQFFKKKISKEISKMNKLLTLVKNNDMD
jgi:hypothetical protein